MDFGEKLKALRKEKKFTQNQLAEMIGVSRRTYIGYEQDGRYPRKREIYGKLAEVLSCDINYLMTENEEFITQSSEKYGTRGMRQAEALVDEFAGLFAGGELDDEDKDVIMRALQDVYWLSKERNKKYTPKKYRTEE